MKMCHVIPNASDYSIKNSFKESLIDNALDFTV